MTDSRIFAGTIVACSFAWLISGCAWTDACFANLSLKFKTLVLKGIKAAPPA